MLVVGTEAGQVLVLEPSGSAVQVRVQLPSAPVLLAVTGMMSVEWRVVCACRDGNVYTIKGGELTGTVIELESMPCCLVRLEKTVVVGCMSNAMHAFHIRGKKTWSARPWTRAHPPTSYIYILHLHLTSYEPSLTSPYTPFRSVYLDAPITSMEVLQLQKTRSLKALLVALLTGEVRLVRVKVRVRCGWLGVGVVAWQC